MDIGDTKDERFIGDIPQLDKSLSNLAAGIKIAARDVAVKHLEMDQLMVARLRDLHALAGNMLGYASRCATVRVGIRQAVAREPFHIISLGYDCLLRTLCAKYGMIESRRGGRLTMPFDLSVHPLNAVVSLVERDFEQYQDASAYKAVEGGMPYHRKLNILFNHDAHPKLVENDFAGLRQALARRSENFRQAASQSGAVMLLHTRVQDIKHLPRALSVLKGRYPNAQIIVINTGVEEFAAPGIDLLRVRVPREKYHWFMVDDFASPEGERFEHDLMAGISERIGSGFKFREVVASLL
jgi:hypothetical protein